MIRYRHQIVFLKGSISEFRNNGRILLTVGQLVWLPVITMTVTRVRMLLLQPEFLHDQTGSL